MRQKGQQEFDFGLAPTGKPPPQLGPVEQPDVATLALYPLFAPTVCWPGYEDIIRSLDWARDDVPMQRFLHHGDLLQGFCTELDALLYLHTASLAAPFSSSWARIMGHLFRRVMTARAVDITAALGMGIMVEQLEPDEEQELARLRRWIFKTQIGRLADRLRRKDKPANKPQMTV